MRTTDAASPRSFHSVPTRCVGHLGKSVWKAQNPLVAGTTNGCVPEWTVSWRQSESSGATRPCGSSRACVRTACSSRRGNGGAQFHAQRDGATIACRAVPSHPARTAPGAGAGRMHPCPQSSGGVDGPDSIASRSASQLGSSGPVNSDATSFHRLHVCGLSGTWSAAGSPATVNSPHALLGRNEQVRAVRLLSDCGTAGENGTSLSPYTSPDDSP